MKHIKPVSKWNKKDHLSNLAVCILGVSIIGYNLPPDDKVEVIGIEYAKLKSEDIHAKTHYLVKSNPPPINKPHDHLLNTELSCLSNNLYYESANQSDLGKVAVAYSTVTRKSRFNHSDLCETVTKAKLNDEGQIIKYKCHFSWLCDGKEKKLPEDEPSKLAFKKSKELSKKVIQGKINNPVPGADHYCRFDSNPYWKPLFKYVGRIDDHEFFDSSKLTPAGEKYYKKNGLYHPQLTKKTKT